MYTAFYGLREKPFALSPDPRFLYLAASHREALAHLLYGIEQGEGFISVTGEVGTGKTTLCRTLLERLEGDIELAFLFNPSRSALELLQSICAEFGLPAEGLGRRNLMAQLNKFLLEQRERGRRVLLIIDEAQTLSENTLEQVRLLSNLETSRDKLIQILLLGQPELDRKLDERGLRQLRQRISVRWTLEPLGADETLAYVRHRIAIAAGQPKDLFTESALREVHRRTGGIPRLVNQLCDRALLAGYAARAAQIGPALIRAAAREIPDVRDPRDRPSRGGRPLLPGWLKRPWMYFALTLAFVGASLAGGLAAGRSQLADSGSGSRGRAGDGAPHVGESGRPVDVADSSVLPAVSAASGADPSTADGSAIGRSPYVGRLLGYVTDPAEIVGSGSNAATRAGVGPGEATATDVAPAALRATDAQLAAAGLSAETFAPLGTSASVGAAPGAIDSAALAALRLAAPVAPRSAVAPGAFPQLLRSRTSAQSLLESERAFLDLYDLPSSDTAIVQSGSGAGPRSVEELQRRLESRGLMATAFDGGNFAMLRRLDHPVLIPVAIEKTNAPAVAVAEADRRWLALTGFEGNRAWLAGVMPGRVVSVDLDELAPRWLEAGVLVWRNHEQLATRVERGGTSASVRWLQGALTELGHYSGRVTGQFDSTTAAALRDFQASQDIVEDGIVGPLTQIALYGKLARYPVPRLSLADQPAAVSTVAPDTTRAASPNTMPNTMPSAAPNAMPSAVPTPRDAAPPKPTDAVGARG